jgi:SAM-dependent methyltransferase
VGCGTGIASRLFAKRGFPVIGVEPNADMRAQAEREGGFPGSPPPKYREGRAEDTGLPDGVADVVLAAQAFHWFEPETTLREFHRILKPDGWTVLLWNERDPDDPFTAAYGTLIRSAPHATGVEVPRARAGEALLSSPWFRDGELNRFRNEQALTEEGLLGRFFSTSYAPREAALAEEFAGRLRALYAHHRREGRVVMRYVTSVYTARRLAPTGATGEDRG